MSRKCQNCGAEMADNMNFCPQCHKKVETAPDIHSTQPAQQMMSPTEAAPKSSKAKKFWSVVGSIFTILTFFWVIFGNRLVNKYLLPAARSEKVMDWCIQSTTLKKKQIKVKHLGNNRYGVFIGKIKVNDEGIGIVYTFNTETEPDFSLVFDPQTNKWSIPEEDKDTVKMWLKD